MAQYKVGNKILSQEERDEDILGFFGFILFSVTALIVGYHLKQWIPAEWAKEYRFLIIFPASIGAGYLASFLAPHAYIASIYLFAGIVWTLLGSFVWWLI